MVVISGVLFVFVLNDDFRFVGLVCSLLGFAFDVYYLV